MKPHARRHRGFEDERGVVYLVPRPTPRWHAAPFWRTWQGLGALVVVALSLAVTAVALLWEAGVIGGGL